MALLPWLLGFWKRSLRFNVMGSLQHAKPSIKPVSPLAAGLMVTFVKWKSKTTNKRALRLITVWKGATLHPCSCCQQQPIKSTRFSATFIRDTTSQHAASSTGSLTALLSRPLRPIKEGALLQVSLLSKQFKMCVVEDSPASSRSVSLYRTPAKCSVTMNKQNLN